MSEPLDAVRYRGKTYPIEAWRLIYTYITRRKAPDIEFHRRMEHLGLTRTEALELYRAQMWRPWEIEFVKVTPPEEEWIADESITGYDIYYNQKTKKYTVRDPETLAPIRTEDKICLELTASIKTSEGHDIPVVVEITACTYIKEKGLTDLIQTEKKVEEGLKNWLIEQGWGNLIKAFEKEGVAYNGKNIIEEKGWYPFPVPDYPKVHVEVEKKKPRKRSYSGEYKVEE